MVFSFLSLQCNDFHCGCYMLPILLLEENILYLLISNIPKAKDRCKYINLPLGIVLDRVLQEKVERLLFGFGCYSQFCGIGLNPTERSLSFNFSAYWAVRY